MSKCELNDKNDKNKRIIPMCDMKPTEVARVIDKTSMDMGKIVMRTATEDTFEVMCLSDWGEYYTKNTKLVELLDHPITLTITND